MKIVAPAGNMERFYSAIAATADEIYLGLKGFGARRNAENFTKEEIKIAIDYAHVRGSKIFLTLNTIMTNKEIEILYPIIKELYNYGLDAIIVQDIGYAKYIHENFPNIEIHGSTQMTIGNYYEINFLKTLGFKRIVLPRELSFEEIKTIRENTDMELEVFVSGALCISISGNCYMSSFIGGRSGNRGMCAQPCRKEYKSSCGEKSYFLSPKDQLYGLEEVKKLKEIGVESIKIEGRMKDIAYVYETVSYFRNLIENKNNEIEEKTSKIFNRGYSKGYFYGTNSSLMNREYSYNIGEKVGEIKKGELKLEANIMCGDGLSFLSKNYQVLGGTNLSRINIRGVNESRKTASIGERIAIDFPMGTRYVYRNFNKEINDGVARNLKNNDKKLEIYGEFFAYLGNKIKFNLKAIEGNKILFETTVEGNNIIDLAKNKSLSSEEIKNKLSEVGDSEFIIKEVEVKKDENIFIALSELKSTKRKAVEEFREQVLKYYRRNLDKDLKKLDKKYFKLEIEIEIEKEKKVGLEIDVLVNDENQKEFLKSQKKEYGISNIYFRTYDIAKHSNLSKHNLLNPLASNFYELLENKNEKVMLNWNMNIVNSCSVKVLEEIEKLDSFIVSPEINFSKIRDLGKTRLKKALLIYSRLKGMTIDVDLSSEKNIENDQGDNFIISKNDYGTEIFLDKALNIINIMEDIQKLNIDKVVLEFTNESIEEMRKILHQLKTKKGEYREYNYKRGVY